MKKKETKQKSELEKAQEIIQQKQQEKVDAFMKDYREICLKHKMELTANPKVEWGVNEIKE